MPNYYREFNLSPSSSEWRIAKTFETKVRSQMEAGEDCGTTLLAFKVLGDDYLKKIYDISLKRPHLVSRPIRGLQYILSSGLELNQDFRKIFTESQFRKSCLSLILLRCFGLDYYIQGLGYSGESGLNLHALCYRSNRLAFLMHNVLYYGIPMLLGVFKPVLWLSIIPLFMVVYTIEYRQAKVEYYETVLKRTVPKKINSANTSVELISKGKS